VFYLPSALSELDKNDRGVGAIYCARGNHQIVASGALNTFGLQDAEDAGHTHVKIKYVVAINGVIGDHKLPVFVDLVN
jgi:hypothetical protein